MKIILGVSLFACGALSMAQTYNFAGDFSVTNGNPNGVWSYGYETTLGGAFINHSEGFVSGDHLWWRTNLESSGVPATFKNTGITPGIGGLLPGKAALHPGPGTGEYSVARFTSPGLVGTLDINGSFGQGDAGIVSVYILKNGVQVFGNNVTISDEFFSISTSIGAFDTIDFIVGSSGIINSDTTPLDANLVLTQSVPEPASLSIVALGSLAFLRRKKSK